MSLIRWQPFREIEAVQREMNRLFDDMLVPSTQRDTAMGITFAPAAELDETEANYQLKLEVPGLDPNDINVEVTAESVSISGERQTETKTEDKGITRSEFRYGRFHRVIPLPGRINNQEVSADYKNGVLHLTLPKLAEEQSKVVKVTVG